MMLDKNICIRANDLWINWAKRLAVESDRTTNELIRDLIYLMIFDDELGQALCQRLKSDQISYNK